MIKREVIRRSIAIHRIKGTVGSVRRALATISFRSDISEWFEHSGDPHTFRIDAFADDIFDAGFQIDAKLHALVTELIQNVKPVRAHFTLRIGEKKGGTVTLRTASRQRVRERRSVTPVVPTDEHPMPFALRTGHRQVVISRHIHTFDLGDAA